MIVERNIRIGQVDRRNVYIDRIEIAELPGAHQTVNHEAMAGVRRLSITGHTIYASVDPRNPDSWSSSGQIQDDVAELVKRGKIDPRFTRRNIRQLLAWWREWHLNDMHAGCVHQTVVYEDGYFGRRASLDLTLPCPVTGYRYGSAWLVKPLPADVESGLISMFGDES